MTRFSLINGDDQRSYGHIIFNGKFLFELAPEVDVNYWNKIGFIKLGDTHKIESNDLFQHLNSRLPITLRDKSNEQKLQYIRETGLRVVSDNFFLKEETTPAN